MLHSKADQVLTQILAADYFVPVLPKERLGFPRILFLDWFLPIDWRGLSHGCAQED